jgi:hypothetical protein
MPSEPTTIQDYDRMNAANRTWALEKLKQGKSSTDISLAIALSSLTKETLEACLFALESSRERLHEAFTEMAKSS